MDQPAEPVSPHDAHTGRLNRQMRTSGGRVLLQGPVRPVSVEVIDVLAENKLQVPFTGDQHPVYALAAGATYPAFADGVGPRRQLHPFQMIDTVGCG